MALALDKFTRRLTESGLFVEADVRAFVARVNKLEP